jgi:hypothetical protein
VQRNLAVRQVERLTPLAALHLQGTTGFDDGADVRDRIVQDESVRGALEVEGLIQVHRLRRVDGDERQIRAVFTLGGTAVRSPHGLGHRLGRITVRKVELLAHGTEIDPMREKTSDRHRGVAPFTP